MRGLERELVMWGEEPDFLEALQEHDFECESEDDFAELDFGSDIAEDSDEEVDEDTEFIDFDD